MALKVLGNRVFVKCGESFTLKFGKTEYLPPLVLTSAMRHPFITVSIKSMTYPQTDRYEMVRWLNCKNVLRFSDAAIMHLGTGTMSSARVPGDDTGSQGGVYKRVYSVLDNGKLVYFYCKSSSSDRIEYKFNWKVIFSSEETQQMTDNEYLVNVNLIDGQSMKETLSHICGKYGINVLTMNDMVSALQNINAPELETLSLGNPLSVITINVPLYQFNIYMEA